MQPGIDFDVPGRICIMKRYRGSSLKIDWQDDELMSEIGDIIDDVTSKAADLALNTAQTIVPVDTGTLRSEIEIKKSKFEHGGYAVVAQGPGNYDRFYATFVELGTHKTVNQPAQPYLRPAIKKVRRMFKKAVQDAIDE